MVVDGWEWLDCDSLWYWWSCWWFDVIRSVGWKVWCEDEEYCDDDLKGIKYYYLGYEFWFFVCVGGGWFWEDFVCFIMGCIFVVLLLG